MSNLINTTLPCEARQDDGTVGCGSSDAMSLYQKPDNGDYNVHCFSCTKSNFIDNNRGKELSDESGTTKRKSVDMTIVDPKDMPGVYTEIKDRGLSKAVCEKYGVKTRSKEGEIKRHCYPYFDKDKNFVGYKTRIVETKKFPFVGDASEITMFGQQLFTEGSAKTLTITEGEIDAMSAYQMNGMLYPVVSISFGAGSVSKTLKNDAAYSFINSFNRIVLSFDMDEQGRAAAKQFSEVFPDKTFTMDMEHKDANEYLKKGQTKEFIKAFYNATQYTPAGLSVSSEFIDSVVEGTVAHDAIAFPYEGVDDMMFGIRTGELTIITAGTGVGKSAVIREIAMNIFQNTKEKIGVLMLEENNQKTATGLVGIHMSKPLILLDLDARRPEGKKILSHIQVTQEERKKAAQEVLGDNRFVLYKNAFSANNIDEIVNKVRQMSKVYGCKYVFLDHISIIVSGQEQGDERKALDETITKLRSLVEETGIHLFVVSHLKRPQGKGHEEGASTSVNELRGSAALGQLADNIIGLERNQQADDAALRNITVLRVLKCRITGLLGPAAYLDYKMETGRISEISEEKYLTLVNKNDTKENSETLEESLRKNKPTSTAIIDEDDFNI